MPILVIYWYLTFLSATSIWDMDVLYLKSSLYLFYSGEANAANPFHQRDKAAACRGKTKAV